MVDEPRVERLLRRVLADVVTLRSLHPHGQPVDSVRVAAIKYGFVTAIEGCTRVAQHIGASEGWRAPDSNADALAILAEQGVIEVELGIDLARAVGFRNLLVHQYADVDDDRVVSMLDRVGDLEDFVGAVSSWIAAQH